MLPACYGSKSTVYEHFQRWSKAGVMAEIFRIPLANIGKSWRGCPMASYGRHLAASPDALSKNQRLRALAATRPTESGAAGRYIFMWMVRVLGVTATGVNVHDSRLIGATLKNFREMCGWFLEAEVRPLCLDKGYDYPRASEEVHADGFEEHIRSRGEEVRERRRNPARREVVEGAFAWLKGFRSLRTRYCCYLVKFMGLLYLALACIFWRKLG